jgi:hypothetical protein
MLNVTVTQISLNSESNPLSSLWGKTLIFRWLYPRKIVNLSESDETGLSRRDVWQLSQTAFLLQHPQQGGGGQLL